MTTYARVISDKICHQLAAGRTLSAVCRDEGMPSREAVRQWVLADLDGFAERYKQARQLGYEVWADEILDIGDEASPISDSIAKARLQTDSRKWLLAKALPKAFGERVALAGDAESPLAVKVIEDQRAPIDELISSALAKVASTAPATAEESPTPAHTAPSARRRVATPSDDDAATQDRRIAELLARAKAIKEANGG